MTPLRWAGLAVIGVVLFYLFSATAVQVGSNPEADLDRVDFVGTALDFGFGGRYLVPPGAYELQVESEGYAPARQAVTVGAQSGQRIVVALERLPGKVAFDTGRHRGDAGGGRPHGRQAPGRIRIARRHARARDQRAALRGGTPALRSEGRRREPEDASCD